MEQLGRYYTANLFSDLLVKSLSLDKPKNILELGVGEGALLKAAYSRWIDASYYVADIDFSSLSKIQTEFPFIKSFHFDTIKEDIKDKIVLNDELIDIAICNPPYLKVQNSVDFLPLFERANLFLKKPLKNITTDAIFLAKNLEILRSNGELGIILPDSIITGKDFEPLRAAILQNHNLKAIIQLPERIFKKTEALTHILIIEKGQNHQCKTPLFLANKNGQIIEEISVDQDQLSNRMDFKFHTWAQRKTLVKSNFKFLHELDAEIRRGNQTHKELKGRCENYLHTSNFNHKKSLYLKKNCTDPRYLMAESGDIIVSRVGKIGKVSYVKRGRIFISDCLYRIRVEKKYRDFVYQSLISKRGEEWFEANSHGVCAKLISKNDLLNFPVFI